ncbi:MAG: Peptidase family [Frankiaceae bacterium]|nr:Peptidase family [Frankiaceae bacterium]
MPTVFLQGGNELTEACRPMDEILLRRAGDGPVVIVPLASRPGSDYTRTGANAVRYFQSLGADATAAPDARRRPDEAATAVEGAGYVVMTGGSPRVLRDALVETGLGAVIASRHAAGCPVMGSSAGAMVACAVTLLPQWRGNPTLGPGLGLVPGHVVVPHFDGSRPAWVRAALCADDVTVLGIPECSGVIVDSAGAGSKAELSAVGVAATSVITARGRSLLVAGDGFEPS